MCFDFNSSPPPLPAARFSPVAGGAAAESIVVETGEGVSFSAAFAESPDPGAGVIILPDVRGLYRFYIELAERFSEAGHHAMAIDYFARTAGTGERGEDFDWLSHLPATDPSLIQRDVAAARAELARRTGAELFVTVGFCFGGAQSFLAGTNPEAGLDAVVGFYGTLEGGRTGMDFLPSPLAKAGDVAVPLLGLFGGADPMIPPEDIKAFEGALVAAGIEHEVKVYPGAPHSFFDRSQEEYAGASADAWSRVLDFIELQLPGDRPRG
jgi:carboxymethylenebutenolidase